MGEVYKNKLTSCFDDILKISAEMMMQQQLKNVQLDPYMVNGFTTQQQHSLKDKIHMFHGMLDDLENALNKSNYYVESLASMGKESRRAEMERLKEEEERKKRLREEEEAAAAAEAKRKEEEEAKAKAAAEAKRKEEEEAAKRKDQEQEAKAKAAKAKAEAEARAAKVAAEEEEKRKRLQEEEEKQKQQQSMFDGLDFTTDLSGDNNNNSTNNSSNNMKSPMGMVQASMGDDANKKEGSSRPFGSDTQKGLYGDLNTMDLSMFSDLDASTFDPASFDTSANSNTNSNNNNSNNNSNNNNNNNNNVDNKVGGNSNDNNQNSDNTNAAFNIQGNADSGMGQDQLDFDQSNPSAMLGNDINMGDNGEDYLTLNDFNDLNIDWSTTGEGGDLDLNGFNI